MKPRLIILAFICVISSSCTDEELHLKNYTNLGKDSVNAVVNPSVETLYSLQTDKQIMLFSMIRYNLNNAKYVLDLSLNDAKLLGISKEAYDDATNLVSKMNE